MSTIKVQPISSASASEIVEFFNSDFLKNEPVSESLGGVSSPAMDLWILRLVEGGLSFEAIDTSEQRNKRVGVFLCTTYTKGVENPIEQELNQFQLDYKMDILLDVLHKPLPFVHKEIFQRHRKNRFFEGVLLSVSPEYGGRGIAGQLIAAAEDKARELAIECVYVCASSKFTASAVVKRGFEVVLSIPWTKYRRNGQPFIFPKHPHEALKCCIKLLK